MGEWIKRASDVLLTHTKTQGKWFSSTVDLPFTLLNQLIGIWVGLWGYSPELQCEREHKMLSRSVEVFEKGLLQSSDWQPDYTEWPPVVTRAKWTLHGQPEGENRDAPIVLLCSARGETLHWRNCLLALISHWHPLWQNGFPSTNPSSQPIRPNGWEQESCSSQNQLENDWVELNQWSAGRQVCCLQDEITWRDNCHARTCIYYSAGYHDQSSRNDGTLSGNSSKSIQGNAVLVWTQPNKPVCVVWPFCQAEMSEHQGKHALGTGKQPLMDRVKEVSSFQKENEMYFWRVSRSFVWGFF